METGSLPKISEFSYLTETFKRQIKLVTEGSSSVCSETRRDGYILLKTQLQKETLKFETKTHYIL